MGNLDLTFEFSLIFFDPGKRNIKMFVVISLGDLNIGQSHGYTATI